MSLAGKSTRGALFLSASSVINIAIGFVGGILLARLLSPADFGTFSLATTIMAFIDIRTKLQLEQKFLRDQADHADYFNTFFTLICGITAFSSVVLFMAGLVAFSLQKPDLAGCLIAMGAMYLLDPYPTAIRVSIEQKVAFRAISMIQTITSVAQFVTTFLCALAGLGLWSLLAGPAVSSLLNFALYARIAPKRPKFQLKRGLVHDFLRFGFKYGITTYYATTVLTQGDNLVVGILGGTTALGFYDRAYRTASWPIILVSTTLGRITLPTYSQLQDDTSRLAKAFGIVLWVVFTFATPISLIFLLTAPELVLVLYGAKWLPTAPILRTLAIFAVCRPLLDNTFSILLAMNRPGQLARWLVVAAIIMMVIIVPLTALYQGVGAAIGSGIAFALLAVLLLRFARMQLHTDVWQLAGKPFMNNVLTAVGYVLLQPYLPVSGLSLVAKLIVEASLILGLYAVVTWVGSSRATRQQFSTIWHHLRR